MVLDATMELGAAAQRRWDAIVVGAGPAGALAARELARRGACVLLVDRAAFPRSKVCGCCLNPWAQATLTHVGLGKLIEEQRAVPITGFRLAAAGSQALVSLTAERALSRQRFDSALAHAAMAAGAN